MSYISMGQTFVAAAMPSPEKLAEMAAKGYEWVPATATAAGYWRKRATTTGTSVTVREQPLTADQQKCLGGAGLPAYRNAELVKCKAWIAAGNRYEDFARALACEKRGYSGQAMAICMEGLRLGKPYSEIDQAITAIAEQAAAEQAAASGRSTRKLLIYGGVAAGLVVLYLMRRKRSQES